MSGPEIAFVIVAGASLLAAIRMVTTKNVVHGALYLVVALAGVGAIYLILAAEFVASVQILVYVGAIVVLLLFSLMLTKAPIGRESMLDNEQRPLAAIVSLVILGGLGWMLWDQFSGAEIVPIASTAKELGQVIFSEMVLPFEAISMLLLAALIGAIVLAKKDEQP